MISRNSILMCVLAAIMIVYLGFAMLVSSDAASRATLRKGLAVAVEDTTLTHFITSADIVRESGLDPDTLDRCLRSTFGLHELETRIARSDKVQDVNAWIGADGQVHVDVVPMTPVARVFEKGKPSYYINYQGKTISADPRYHLDVPVVLGHFDARHPATRLLPMMDYIARRPELSALVSTIVQEPDGDIIIVPAIVGHVINFGDTSDVEDKFARLDLFYRKVAPVKGWEMYDTVAVKWSGRVVGTRRNKRMGSTLLATTLLETAGDSTEVLFSDFDDAATITDPLTVAEGLAPEDRKPVLQHIAVER